MQRTGPRARRTEGATRGQVPAHRHLRARRRGLPHGGVAAGGDHRPPRLLPGAQRPPRRERRARRHHHPHTAGCRAHRPRRCRRRAGGHRRPVPGVQGVGRRLPGGRRRDRGARPGDRRAGVSRARSGWGSAAAAHPRAAGDGRRPVRRRLDERVAAGCRGRALTGADRPAEDLLRDLAPQVVGILSRRSGDFSAAEDAVQEALVAAHTTWPRDGITDNPRGWLLTAASRRLVDEQRSAAARRRREQDWAAGSPEGAEVVQHDDSLTVLLLCCHPALSPASAVALTLRAVGGLTTAEIATAYVVPESTMAQRISRAKATLRDLGEPFDLPVGDRLELRVARALAVLYLLYNEGYAASAGPDIIRA